MLDLILTYHIVPSDCQSFFREWIAFLQQISSIKIKTLILNGLGFMQHSKSSRLYSLIYKKLSVVYPCINSDTVQTNSPTFPNANVDLLRIWKSMQSNDIIQLPKTCRSLRKGCCACGHKNWTSLTGISQQNSFCSSEMLIYVTTASVLQTSILFHNS